MRKTKGSVLLPAKFDVRGMVMVAGMLSLKDDAKGRRHKIVKREKTKEVEEAMAALLQKRTPMGVAAIVLYRQ